MTDTLHFWYWELKFVMLFFHEAIFCDLYSAVLEDAQLKKWNKNIQAILYYWKNDITAVQTVFLIWSHSFVMHWYKMKSLKIIDYLCSLVLCIQGDWCEEQNEVLTQALAVMIECLKHADDAKSHHWWQPADFEWIMQNKKGLWMDNHVPQILNADLDAFSFSDFCHWPLIFVSTVGAGCVFMLTATSGSCCSQFLEFMIMSTSIMPHEQWALTPESAPLTGLSLDLNWGQGSLQIPPFHNEIKNWSQGSAGDTRGQRNCERAGPGTGIRRHPWEGSGHNDHEQGHEESGSDNTADDKLMKF